MIQTESQLAEAVNQVLAASWLALDTEADSLHCYPEKLCLLQLGLPGGASLIDPLCGLNLAPLLQAMQPHQLIMHGADYDLRLLHRQYQFVPQAVFDTMLAARLLGLSQFGLVHLVDAHLHVKLEKGQQKANWARRPLTERMRHYALSDVHYLKPLADWLRRELQQQGRLAWHEEFCQKLIREAIQSRLREEDDVWRIGGSERLGRHSLAVLRELWHWRETEAIQAHKPPFFILSHTALIDLAQAAVHGLLPLPLPHSLSQSRRKSLQLAIQRGQQTPTAALPTLKRASNHRLTQLQLRLAGELRKRRDHHARELGLDPSLIASRSALFALARDPEKNAPELMAWQRRLLEL